MANLAASALSTASSISSEIVPLKRLLPPKWSYTTRAAESAPAMITWLGLPLRTRSVSLEWWSNARCALGTYGRFVVMSRSPISTLPSWTSFGWTNLMSSISSSCFSSAAQTRPSKSLRVTSLYVSGIASFPAIPWVQAVIGTGALRLECYGRIRPAGDDESGAEGEDSCGGDDSSRAPGDAHNCVAAQAVRRRAGPGRDGCVDRR